MITELSIGEVLLYSLAGILTVIVVLAMLACLITIVSRLVAKFAAKPVKEPVPGPDVLKIEEIKEDGIVLFLSERAGSVEIGLGKPYDYRPFSMDGGHYYKISLE